MKKMIFIFWCASVVILILGFQIAQGQDGIKLKMADSFPIGHVGHHSALHFIKSVEEATQNKVKIEYFPASQIGKLKDFLNLCAQGIVDIAYVPPSFYAGQVPLNTVMILPFWTTAVEGTEIYIRLMEDSPELKQEFLKYGVRPLVVNSTSQYDVGTVKKPIQSPEDLKGVKLKTSGGLFDKIARQYGIIPVAVAAPEVYEATQRGVVEGNIFSFPSVKGYRVNELEKYHTYGARLGGYPSTYQINEKAWQKLPGDIQKILLAAAKNNARYTAETWDKEQLKLVEQFEKEGMRIYRILSKDRARWDAPLQGIEKVWIEEVEKRELPGKKVFENFQKICQEVAR